MREDYSPAQNMTLDFLQKVSCASITQINYMLYKAYGATPGQAEYVVHSLVNDRIAHCNGNFTWVAIGKDGTPSAAKLSADTIRAISVALEVIEDEEDFKTIYKPFSGSDLCFYTADTAFEVINCSMEHIDKLLYFEKMHADQYKVRARKLGEDFADQVSTKYLLTFPSGTDPRPAIRTIKKLELTMPFSICVLKGKTIFERNKLDVYEL